MADRPKYSTIQQHQPLYAPKGWNEEEKRFVRTLQGILEDIYKRYGRLGLNDLSKVFRGTVTGLESDMGAVQGNVTTLAGAFEQLAAAVATLNTTKLAKSEVLDAVYPIGSLYMSVNAAEPSALFGGTWERLKDRFLLAAGDTYVAGATGGEATHTHTHDLSTNLYTAGAGSGNVNMLLDVVASKTAWTANWQDGPIAETSSTSKSTKGIRVQGDIDSASNMPPYLTVYMWKRTA